MVILNKPSNRLGQDMIDILREQRHDFLNHFQVVLGYLQLNKTDRAAAYIKQVNLEMQESSNITKLENPYLVVALLLAEQKSQSMGIYLSFQVEQGVSLGQDYGEDLVDQLSILIDQIICLLSVRDEEQWMEITLKETIQDIIWVITCPPFLPIDALMHQLPNHLDQDLMKRGNLKADQWLEQIRLIFHIPKNN